MLLDQDIKQPLPWHQPVWKQLQQSVASDRLPHALLLMGPKGIGKRLFAQHLAQLLLCQNSQWDELNICGSCSACIKFANNAHPDLRRLEPQENKRDILIDDVRNIISFIQLSAQVAKGCKIVIVDPADHMTRSAANALLKTLEEPPQNRVLILIAESLGKLPTTIRSRCQLVRFPVADESVATTWLSEITNGEYRLPEARDCIYTPIAALSDWQNRDENHTDGPDIWGRQWKSIGEKKASVLDVAAKWSETDDKYSVIHWLQKEIYSAQKIFLLINSETDSHISNIFVDSGLQLREILLIQSKIKVIYDSVETNINVKLVWETFLLECHRMIAARKASN